MAHLPDTARAKLWAEFMRTLSSFREQVSIGKVDLRAAIDAADTWVSDNEASYNSALPAAAQAGLTTAQKDRLIVLVSTERLLLEDE